MKQIIQNCKENLKDIKNFAVFMRNRKDYDWGKSKKAKSKDMLTSRGLKKYKSL